MCVCVVLLVAVVLRYEMNSRKSATRTCRVIFSHPNGCQSLTHDFNHERVNCSAGWLLKHQHPGLAYIFTRPLDCRHSAHVSSKHTHKHTHAYRTIEHKRKLGTVITAPSRTLFPLGPDAASFAPCARASRSCHPAGRCIRAPL